MRSLNGVNVEWNLLKADGGIERDALCVCVGYNRIVSGKKLIKQSHSMRRNNSNGVEQK